MKAKPGFKNRKSGRENTHKAYQTLQLSVLTNESMPKSLLSCFFHSPSLPLLTFRLSCDFRNHYFPSTSPSSCSTLCLSFFLSPSLLLFWHGINVLLQHLIRAGILMEPLPLMFTLGNIGSSYTPPLAHLTSINCETCCLNS